LRAEDGPPFLVGFLDGECIVCTERSGRTHDDSVLNLFDDRGSEDDGGSSEDPVTGFPDHAGAEEGIIYTHQAHATKTSRTKERGRVRRPPRAVPPVIWNSTGQ